MQVCVSRLPINLPLLFGELGDIENTRKDGLESIFVRCRKDRQSQLDGAK